MSTTPTAALTLGDLVTEVAIKLGVAYYGEDGDEEAQAPVEVHDLAECKRHVNNAIRMFLSDAPPNGWRCQHPVAEVILWPSVAVDDDITATGVYEPATDTTLVTASDDSFYESMEQRTLTVTDVDDLTIDTYVSATVVRVAGDHHWAGSKTFSLTSDGTYTLPRTFGGEVTGDITFGEDTSPIAGIAWDHEVVVRRLRQDTTQETGQPYRAATRKMADGGSRWELLVWPIPSETYVVEFPYELYFDKLVALTERHPCGHVHDEAMKAACFAVMERDSEDLVGDLMAYYRKVALPNSYRIDSRQAPRTLSKMGSRRRITPHNFRDFQRRPSVTYDTP